jgi:glucose-1-phosphate thymidylyltransferase
VCYGVLRALARAGVERAYVPIRSGKWDVPAHLRQGEAVGVALSYLVLEDSPSPAHSVDAAYPFTAGSIVALGFPDVLLRIQDPFRALLDRWHESEADIVLGLFPPSPDYRTERVAVGEDGRVTAIDPEPAENDERPTWTLAVWGPDFGHYLHEAVAAWDRAAARASESGDESPRELVFGDALRTALEDGIVIDGVSVSEEPFVDVGDPERLMAAMRDAYGH